MGLDHPAMLDAGATIYLKVCQIKTDLGFFFCELAFFFFF